MGGLSALEPTTQKTTIPGIDDSVGSGLEEASFFGLPAGTYVLEVAECSYLGSFCRTPVFGDNTVMTVTVTDYTLNNVSSGSSNTA